MGRGREINSSSLPIRLDCLTRSTPGGLTKQRGIDGSPPRTDVDRLTTQREATFLPSLAHPQTRIYERTAEVIKLTRQHAGADSVPTGQTSEGYLLRPPDRDAVELVTSEITTNTVQHATGAAFLMQTGWMPDGRFFLAVASDSKKDTSVSTNEIQPGNPTSKSESGRGLLIVDALTDAWGTAENITIEYPQREGEGGVTVLKKVWDNVVWAVFPQEAAA